MTRLSLLIIVILLSIFISNESKGQLLWEISKPGSQKSSYIFGTIHIKNAKVFLLSDKTQEALKKCDVFVSELDFDSVNQETFKDFLFLQNDSTLKDLYTEEEYLFIKKKVEELTDYKIEELEYFKPFTIMGLLNKKDSTFLNDPIVEMDIYLYSTAKNSNKRRIGIESIQEQLKVLDLFPKEMLIRHLIDFQSSDSIYNELIEAYLAENIEKVEQLTISSLVTNINQKNSSFINLLINERNKVMSDRIEKLIRNETVFIAVGASHLGNQNGIINLLVDRGFECTPLMGLKK